VFERTDQPDIHNLDEHAEIDSQLKDIDGFQEAANRKEKELEGTGQHLKFINSSYEEED
jgi:hypothetical protein